MYRSASGCFNPLAIGAVFPTQEIPCRAHPSDRFNPLAIGAVFPTLASLHPSRGPCPHSKMPLWSRCQHGFGGSVYNRT